MRVRIQPSAIGSVPPVNGSGPVGRYSMNCEKSGVNGGPSGAGSTSRHGRMTGGAGAQRRSEMRVLPSTAVATARSSPFCESVARNVETPLPRRTVSIAIVAAPVTTGPASSPVSERSTRSFSGSHASIARVSAPSTSPPNAPRPWFHPGSTSSVNTPESAVGVGRVAVRRLLTPNT